MPFVRSEKERQRHRAKRGVCSDYVRIRILINSIIKIFHILVERKNMAKDKVSAYHSERRRNNVNIFVTVPVFTLFQRSFFCSFSYFQGVIKLLPLILHNINPPEH